MKKIILGILAGLVLGAATTWLVLRPHEESPGAPKPEAEAPPPGVLRLNQAKQTAAGLVLTNPIPIEIPVEQKAFGRVLDVSALATVLAEIDITQVSLNASTREYERLKSLGQEVSARAREAAETARHHDQATLAAAQSRLVADWGKSLTARTNFTTLAQALVAREAALVRVDLPAGETLGAAAKSLRVAALAGEGGESPAEFVGPAPVADAQAQGQGFLGWVSQPPWPPGTALAAWIAIDAPPRKGFRLPRSAVVQVEGGQFVFVRTKVEEFERHPVETLPQGADAVFILSGVAASDPVVVIGAQQLLSEEFKGSGAAD